MDRVRTKKAEQDSMPKNTDHLTTAQQNEIDAVDRRRATPHAQEDTSKDNPKNNDKTVATEDSPQ